jgi:hypothetical protein
VCVVAITYQLFTHTHTHTQVFAPQTAGFGSQSAVFDEVSGLVQSALDGYNVTLFSYGQVYMECVSVRVCVCMSALDGYNVTLFSYGQVYMENVRVCSHDALSYLCLLTLSIFISLPHYTPHRTADR